MIILRVSSLFFCLFWCCTLAQGQALNTIFRSNWDDNNLPSQSGVVFNDLWGYADGEGREYAIVGSRLHTHFIDITDPDNPKEVDRETGGSNCLWRDYKTFGHYAYGVSEICNGGLEIFDLSPLPDSVHKVYDSNEFTSDTHNVFIDTAKGKLYATGINSGATNIVILDLNANPEQPTLLKNLSLPDGYVHDLYVRNDTAYCSHIYRRKLIIYDFSNLDDVTSIGMLSSPGANHSNWVTDDGQTIVIADESFGRPVIVADISDIESPEVITTFESTLLGSGSIAHNPFIVGNDFVVLSYYDDGLQIYKIDTTSNPFLAGYYDTEPIGTSYQSDGAWGAYPYLPSGNLIASDIQNGLFVVTPQFPLRDCQSDVLVRGIYNNHWDIVSKDKLTNGATYQNGANVIFRATDQFELLPGFSLGEGATLDALFEDQCSVVSNRAPGKKRRKK